VRGFIGERLGMLGATKFHQRQINIITIFAPTGSVLDCKLDNHDHLLRVVVPLCGFLITFDSNVSCTI